MASWYERSSTWRRIVAVTKHSPGGDGCLHGGMLLVCRTCWGRA